MLRDAFTFPVLASCRDLQAGQPALPRVRLPDQREVWDQLPRSAQELIALCSPRTGAGVGRGLGVTRGLGVGVGLAVAVAVGLKVGLGVGLGVEVGVGVGLPVDSLNA